MGARIQLRRDTVAGWGTDVILEDGELGYQKDNRVLKIGDGITQWASLPRIQFDTNGTEAQKGMRLVEGVGIDNQLMAASSSYTVAHGLGVAPDLIIASLRVVVAFSGWLVGDEIKSWHALQPVNHGDAVNLTARTNNNSMQVTPKAGGVAVTVVWANVRLRLRPFKLVNTL